MSDLSEPTVTLPATDIAYPFGDRLPENGLLGRGCGLRSQDGQVFLILTLSGNLVLTNLAHTLLWSVLDKEITYLIMQSDGKCVAYTSSNKPVWDSGSNGGYHPYQLVCQNDGNLAVHGAQRFWSSRTADRFMTCESANLKVLGQQATGFSKDGFMETLKGFNATGFTSDEPKDSNATETSTSEKNDDDQSLSGSETTTIVS
ncbi:hypothetical protein V5O48_017338 [Marasmius crinis-equi]|uniref:Bulb-type lectin domain-containing protein n=1 Tax=Marasmius crinis-equi TaxID=585013 RepID=A0ABR3EP96_9AGAR